MLYQGLTLLSLPTPLFLSLSVFVHRLSFYVRTSCPACWRPTATPLSCCHPALRYGSDPYCFAQLLHISSSLLSFAFPNVRYQRQVKVLYIPFTPVFRVYLPPSALHFSRSLIPSFPRRPTSHPLFAIQILHVHVHNGRAYPPQVVYQLLPRCFLILSSAIGSQGCN